MNSLYRDDFTVEDGLAYQRADLASWKYRLNERSYALLEAECERQNTLPMKWGYDVYRGSSISNFISNIKP